GCGMALDMSSGGGAPRWFGFSPAVVLVAAAVLLGGGVAVAKSGGPSYTEGVVALCEESNAKAAKDPLVGEPSVAEFPRVVHLRALSAARLRALDALRPPSGRAEDFESLKQRERWVQDVLRDVDEAARSGRRGAAREPTTLLMVHLGQLDDLYRSEFGVEACGLPAWMRETWDEAMRRYDTMGERRTANP
ncbi:MAG: hypothetical protein Q7T55_06285, partial [Solirubrobacteraceae bacterium]|nr:hypothetical protein [Solirubrobacteraceae bacterium]